MEETKIIKSQLTELLPRIITGIALILSCTIPISGVIIAIYGFFFSQQEYKKDRSRKEDFAFSVIALVISLIIFLGSIVLTVQSINSSSISNSSSALQVLFPF